LPPLAQGARWEGPRRCHGNRQLARELSWAMLRTAGWLSKAGGYGLLHLGEQAIH